MPKLLIKDLCKFKLGWDESISIYQEQVWIKWLKGIDVINSLTVDRCLIPMSNFVRVEIHAYSDASSDAYAAVVFLRVVYTESVKISF